MNGVARRVHTANGDSFDAAIVGAGIIGAAVAAEICRRRPDWRVLVLEVVSD